MNITSSVPVVLQCVSRRYGGHSTDSFKGVIRSDEHMCYRRSKYGLDF